MSSRKPSPEVPLGGTTGADHADTGVCPFHSSVMVAPGGNCPICQQQALVSGGGRAESPPERRPAPVHTEEQLPGPTEIPDPRGHVSMGDYN